MTSSRQMAETTSEFRDSGERALAPDPVIDVYKRDVDRTLLREQLRRTIDERVRRMIEALRLAAELRAAGRREPR
jgi:hypothetical protein